MSQKFGQQIIQHLDTIYSDAELDPVAKRKSIFKLFNHFFSEITYKENIQLSTLFSKLSFVGNKYKLRKILLYHLHGFRKSIETAGDASSFDLQCIFLSFKMAIADILDIRLDRGIRLEFFESFGQVVRSDRKDYIASMEVIVEQIDTREKVIHAIPNDSPFARVVILYDQSGRNELFTANIEKLEQRSLLPCAMYLHEIDVLDDEMQSLLPTIFVFEPHYLLDVTAVASTFDHSGSVPQRAMISRFQKVYQSLNIFIGNVANYFLDEIIHNPQIAFEDLLPRIFQLDPILIANYDDETVRKLVEEAQKHFNHLKEVVQRELLKNGITGKNVYLEPSFYAPSYGMQGRLDVFYQEKKENRAAIIELKSSKVFRPNTYRLNNAHYVQTLLYDLLVKSVYGNKLRSNAFILYSKMDKNQLRHAPVVKSQQQEAIEARNDILLDMFALENADTTYHVFDGLRKKALPKQIGFQKEKLDTFEKVYTNLSDEVKAYFKAFAAFIAKEQRLSKVGNGQLDRLRGRSNLWLTDIEDKKENFNILNHLVIKDNQTDQDVPKLILDRTIDTAVLSNFRVGDIIVFYPDNESRDGAIFSQVFKGNILEISEQHIAVRLRNKQHNSQIFDAHKLWHLEHDMYDSSFNAMFRSLFEFVRASDAKHDLWLGKVAPASYAVPDNLKVPKGLTDEQAQIFTEIISAENYYLLWGPPGTGKTSVMLKELVRHFYYDTDETILLLAYTNKAVDEICEALYAISELVKEHFIRIGSRFSTKEKFISRLLFAKTEHMSRRAELTGLISDTRIFVGTLASVSGKETLFQLKQFDRIIIDEASQILEPQLLDLLIRIPKAILIGDHKQLPAVVQQRLSDADIKNEKLREWGLKNMADSLFERLYKRCLEQNWDWAIGQLGQQGRMHQDLMAFPNQQFYNGSLDIIPEIARLSAKRDWIFESDLQALLAQADKRVLFFGNKDETSFIGKKTNEEEAALVSEIVQAQLDLLKLNDQEFTPKSIGIITPFRAQIACIREQLIQDKRYDERITIDTVERFQGDAKDLIIISFCMNHEIQLRSLISKSSEGIDRKLNVALTRAKEQLVLLGNQSILSQDQTYSALISWAQE